MIKKCLCKNNEWFSLIELYWTNCVYLCELHIQADKEDNEIYQDHISHVTLMENL